MMTVAVVASSVSAKTPPDSLSLIVMDPLAAPLSCPCVEGYAQRKYEVLAEYLKESLGRPVELTFGESFAAAMKKAGGRVDIVIGKDSVVRSDCKAADIGLFALGHLTDKQGSVEQYGMIVVNRDDPARAVADLKAYTICFGPAEADEKHSEALATLKAAGISVPRKLTIDDACSDGACRVIDLGPQSRTAAVISSYAQPLLEGCGTIKKGDLRVVGKTKPVKFITAFASRGLDQQTRTQVRAALLDLAVHPDVLAAMESLVGFLPAEQSTDAAPQTRVKKKT